ncbi:5609_t:CDS:2, partial [Gigaspora margarita]
WIVTKVILDHDHPMVELNEVATFPQYLIDGGIICTKDVVNERARIRYILNEGYNNDSVQKLLKLFEERDYIVIPLKTVKGHLTHLFFSYVEAAKCVARCPEVLIVDTTYKTNIYKFPLVSAIGINNVSNEKGTLVFFQIAMAWMEDETEASYTWFLQTLHTKIYNTYEQNLKANCCKLFKTDDDYEVFKKEVVNLRFTTVEEQISQSLSAIKKAAKKAHIPEKVELYIQILMKDSTIAFKRAIETANDLDSVFRQIDQTMCLQHLKASMHTVSNKVAIDPFICRDPRFSELIGNIS